VRKYILFHDIRHPKDLGMPEINQFLTHLAVEKKLPPQPKTRPWAHCSSYSAMCWTWNLA